MKHGFYNELDLLRNDSPEASFSFLEIQEKSGNMNALDFLHGYCLSFAICLSNRFKYPIETLRDEGGDLIHAYCVDSEKGLYIDVRGITNDPDLFFDEFSDEVDYANGQFWCLNDQAKVEIYENTSAYLAEHSGDDLRLLEASKLISRHSDYYDTNNHDVLNLLRMEHLNKNKWFIEVVQDMDGTYYANMVIAGRPVQGLPDHVDYNALREGIKWKTGIEILKRKDMQFQQCGRKKYAYIDATQYRGEGKDCRVSLDEMRAGWRPDFGDTQERPGGRKLSLDDRVKAAEVKYCSAPASSFRSDHER